MALRKRNIPISLDLLYWFTILGKEMKMFDINLGEEPRECASNIRMIGDLLKSMSQEIKEKNSQLKMSQFTTEQLRSEVKLREQEILKILAD